MEDAHQYIKPETNLIEVCSAASTHNQEILEANSLFNTQRRIPKNQVFICQKQRTRNFIPSYISMNWENLCLEMKNSSNSKEKYKKSNKTEQTQNQINSNLPYRIT